MFCKKKQHVILFVLGTKSTINISAKRHLETRSHKIFLTELIFTDKENILANVHKHCLAK